MEGSETLFCSEGSQGQQKYFFKIYREFGHLPSKRFTSAELGYNDRPFKTTAKGKKTRLTIKRRTVNT